MPSPGPGTLLVRGYGDGGFRIGEEFIKGSILLRPDRVEPWSVASAAGIDEPSLRSLSGCGILLIGCGAEFVSPPQGLAAALRPQGAALEWMATGPACRTYNLLVLEGRAVAAALIAV
jgi:uncharacterized protein